MTELAIIRKQQTAVAPPREYSLSELVQMADLLIKSRLVPEAIQTKEQAAIIMLKGQELGLKPMQAMSDIYVVYGQAHMGTKLMCALFKAAGHRYEVLDRTKDVARVKFMLADGTSYTHTMTMEEVSQAGWNKVGGKIKYQWTQMPAVMLMYRCLSSGIRMLAPEVLHGMGVVDSGTREVVSEATVEQANPYGDVIDGVATVVQDNDEPESSVPEQVKARFTERLAGKPNDPPDTKRRNGTVGSLNALFTFGGASAEVADDMRHKVTQFLLGKPESATWTDAECYELLRWATTKNEAGEWVPSGDAVQEAAAIVAHVEQLQGQLQMAMEGVA